MNIPFISSWFTFGNSAFNRQMSINMLPQLPQEPGFFSKQIDAWVATKVAQHYKEFPVELPPSNFPIINRPFICSITYRDTNALYPVRYFEGAVSGKGISAIRNLSELLLPITQRTAQIQTDFPANFNRLLLSEQRVSLDQVMTLEVKRSIVKSKIPADQFDKIKNLFDDPDSEKPVFKPNVKEKELNNYAIPEETKDILRQALQESRVFDRLANDPITVLAPYPIEPMGGGPISRARERLIDLGILVAHRRRWIPYFELCAALKNPFDLKSLVEKLSDIPRFKTREFLEG